MKGLGTSTENKTKDNQRILTPQVWMIQSFFTWIFTGRFNESQNYNTL